MKSDPIVSERVRPKGEKRRSSWQMLLLVLGVLAALVVVPFLILRPRAEVYTLRSYQTAPVERGTLIDYVRGSGRLVPRIERSLLAAGDGVLTSWRVAEGDEVMAGETLGYLSSPALAREVTTQEAAVGSARRELAELTIRAEAAAREAAREQERLGLELTAARQKLATTRALVDIGAASQGELDAAALAVRRAELALEGAVAGAQAARETGALALANAEAALAGAQAALELARSRVAALELRAPVAGQVIGLRKDVGETVTSGEVLAVIASSADLRVEASLTEAQASQVGVGQRAVISVAGQDYPGTVVRVSPQTETRSDGSAVVPVTLSFDEAPSGLRVGASAAVEIEVGRQEEALYLPRGPYLTTGGERFVYLINGEGDTATRQPALFGLVDGNRVEVRDGLSEGQRIITSSYEAFKEWEEIALVPTGEIQ